jgi:KDO2-lipid IV(A) lauroyltransferase
MLLGAFRLMARLPLTGLQWAGRLLGCLVYWASPGYRHKIRANLARAGYPPGLRAQAARAAGEMAAELPWIWFREPGEVLQRVRCADDTPVREALAGGRGVLFLTPHLGCFEITARWCATRGPITVLFRPPKLAALDAVLQAARNIGAMTAVPASVGGVRALLRALRRGESVGLLPDQVPGAGDGRWAPFLGAPAYTMTLPLRLAQASGAAVVLLVGERLSAGRGWQIHAEAMREAPTPEALNAAMERLVHRFPPQYLWGYNRYKQPAGGPATNDAEGTGR